MSSSTLSTILIIGVIVVGGIMVWPYIQQALAQIGVQAPSIPAFTLPSTLSFISPQAQAPKGVPTPPKGSISYNPVTKSYIQPNVPRGGIGTPGGTKLSCAGLTGATCTACCKAKGLSRCDCSTAQYARAFAGYTMSGRPRKFKHMRSFNNMPVPVVPSYRVRYNARRVRKLPTVYQ